MKRRRGNGLLADAYVPLAMLAPGQADRMLEALRRSGIAAYAVPLEEDVLEPSGGAGEPPTDHLYVDAEERAAAERLLGTELPGPDGLLAPDGEVPRPPRPPSGGDLLEGPAGHLPEDEVFNDLVARFYGETAAERGRVHWPDAENLDPSEEGVRGGDLLADGPPGGEPDDRDRAAEAARRRSGAEQEGHYEPPPPPPLLQGDRVGIAAWCGTLGAPALIFGSFFAGIPLPGWLMLLVTVAFLAGFVVLILRMADGGSDGDGPDDGAVV
ncbi:hypothetical protein [Nocardiopsis sp. CNT312]|uniref:hypothetical protein n=1 Tax=Nocardiopsis sp. CNT312 TaxID=1137268 RepID=UPI00048CD78C|nr:hypothetical protein [Nocardiopsis sp. CNT312]